MKNNDLELKTRIVLKLLGLKRSIIKEYSDKHEDNRLFYVFKDYNEFANYLFSNGVAAIDKDAVSLAIFHIEKDGKIVAFKSACDDFIRLSKGNYKLRELSYSKNLH